VYSGVDAERIETIGGGLQSQTLRFNALDVQTNTRDGGWLQFQRSREVVDAPFTLYSEPGRIVAMQPGDYEFDEATIGLNTANQRRYSGGLRLTTGEFYDGDRNNVNVNFQWNHSRYFLLNLNYDWNDIKLPQGDFTTRLVSVNAQVAFSSQLFWVSLVQYDNVSEELGLNTRLQWIPKAGQEGFIVLNYNLQDKDKDNTFKSQAMDVSIKFKYTFRY